jgi:predicted metal-dependent peptidase
MANENSRDVLQQLSDARTQLIMHFPFFGYLALNLSFWESEQAGGYGTAAVTPDGRMFYNPEFFRSMDLVSVMNVLCHELMHIVQSCSARFPEAGNHQLWNIAADYVVNSIIVESKMPIGKVMDEIFPEKLRTYAKGKSTEEIYLDLMKKQAPKGGKDKKQQGKGQGNGPCDGSCQQGGNQPGDGDGQCQGGHGNGDPSPDFGDKGGHEDNNLGCPSGSHSDEKMSNRQKRDWQQKVIGAAQAAEGRGKARGDLPGFIQEFLATLNKPTITWKDHLRSAAQSAFKGRYSWNKPARRSAAMGVRFQSRKPTPKGAVVMLDTSGSISERELNQFLSECAGILKTSGAPWIHIYFHDTECYYDEHFNKRTLKRVNIRPGGTSHHHVFEKVHQDKEDVGMIVAFTDMMSSFPDHQPPCPVIWGVPSADFNRDYGPSWGKKVEVKMNLIQEK